MKYILLRIVYYSGLWLFFRHLNKHRALILMYHGISRSDLRISTQIPESRFEAQMAYLAKYYKPISLHESVRDIKEDKIKPHAVSVTFDDGFENNASIAFPILQKYNIPSTIFITVGFIDHLEPCRGFCWPNLVYVLLKGCKQSSLDLTDQGLETYGLGSHSQINFARHQICQHLKAVPDLERQNIIRVIKERTGNTIEPKDRERFSPMSWQQVQSIQQSGLGSIGAHTVKHPVLTRITLDQAEQEMVQSKQILEQKLDAPVIHFAYPFGSFEDVNDEIAARASKHFTCAVTAIKGFNDKDTNLYALRRLGIGNDMPLWRFKVYLSGATLFLKEIFNNRIKLKKVTR